MHYLFSAGLFIHIIGITCIAGGSIGGLVLETHLWKLIRQTPEKVPAVAPVMPKYPVIIQVGTILMVISGLMMLASLDWFVASQWWFIIKMILVAALVLNGMLVAKPNGEKLRMLVPKLIRAKAVPAGFGEELSENSVETEITIQQELETVRKKMIAFHISEMALLVIVYLLAVFRF